MGAQGQSYGSYTGGYGGSVTGTFWLRKGEILTYVVGGQMATMVAVTHLLLVMVGA